jgi:uncharacterized protein YdiU (UPF0061 family)
MKINFDNSYEKLGENFFQKINPTPVSDPQWIQWNEELARELGLPENLASQPETLEVFSGNKILSTGSYLSMAYAGHQFGHFVPQLGDGRAILLGEVIDRSGRRRDIQLKGAGRSKFSRQGDGRSALGPVIREYLMSEAMWALKVPTTRALAAVLTGEWVARETPLPGAIFTRVASSHIRVGSFEYFSARQDFVSLKKLVDYSIDRHWATQFLEDEQKSPSTFLLRMFSEAQASLIVQWLHLGFIHGVMNTDNTSLVGETIDYGPCAFMDEFNPDQVFSSIDRHGRYAFGNQPAIAQWNLLCLFESLRPLLEKEISSTASLEDLQHEISETFADQFRDKYLKAGLRKLGISDYREADQALFVDFLEEMHKNSLDFTLSFSSLRNQNPSLPSLSQFSREWVERWIRRRQDQDLSWEESEDILCQSNPYLIPRNHLIQRAIDEAISHQNFSEMKSLLEASKKPFELPLAKDSHYLSGPKEHEKVRQTFCGT